MSLIASALVFCVLLAAGNYHYAYLRGCGYADAHERTYFQVVAVVIFSLILWLTGKDKP